MRSKTIPIHFICILLILPLSQCDFVNFDSEVIDLNVDVNEMSADGYSQIPVRVQLIHDDTNNAGRNVKVESTGGTFVTQAGLVKEVTINLKGTSEETIYFVPGIVPGTFEIKASIVNKTDYFKTKQIVLNPVAASEVIKLVLTSSVGDDGRTIVDGQITLTNTNKRTLEVTSTDKSAIFDGDTDFSTQIIADVNGAGAFKVRSGTSGSFFIVAKLLDDRNLTLQKPYTVDALSSNDVIELTIPLGISDSIFADGYSEITGQITIKKNSINVAQITSNNGLLIGPPYVASTEVVIDAAGAKAIKFRTGSVIPDDDQTVVYTTEAKLKGTNFSDTTSIVAHRAKPDSLYIEPTFYEIDSLNGEITVQVLLGRQSGKVTDGAKVYFAAYQVVNGSPQSVGRFANFGFSYSRTQQCSSKFITDTRRPRKTLPIIIQVSTKKNTGGWLVKRIQLNVKK